MYPKWLWPVFALPGVVWLILLFFGAHFTVQPAAGPGA